MTPEIRARFPEVEVAVAALGSFPPGKRPRGAYADALHSYARGLLPAILGGEWGKSKQDGYWLLNGRASLYGRPERNEPCPGQHECFDHQEAFYLKGSRGPRTWNNTALLGQPYRMPTAWCAAADWLAARGVCLWARRDLSMWYPGQTVLTVAARGLLPEAAEKFGFVALTEPKDHRDALG